MTEREAPLRLLFVGGDGAAVERVMARLGDDEAEVTRVDPGADPADVAFEECDCVVVHAGDEPWRGVDPGASVPVLRVPGRSGEDGDAAADRLAARVRAVTGVTEERRRAVERSVEEVYAVDADWRVVLWNDAMAEWTGRPAASVLGEVLWDAFPSLVGTRIEAEFRGAAESGEARTFEARPTGFDARVESRVFPDDPGLTVYSRNVTEHRERARRLDRYEAALDSLRDPVFVVDGDRRVAFANGDVFARVAGPNADATDVTGATVRDLFGGAVDPDDLGRLERALGAALDAAGAEGAAEFERRVLVESADCDEWAAVDCRVTPFVSGGDPHALVVGRDVTELERANRETRTAVARLEALAGTAPTPVIGVNPAGEVTLWNDAAEAVFGWSIEEVLGEFNPIVPESERAGFEVNRRRLLDGERIVGREVRRRNRAGETLELRLSATPVRGSGEEVIGVFEDLTQRKRYERRLRALQRATGRLNVASTTDDVAGQAVAAAVEVLDMELTALYEYDPGRDALVPRARGAGTGETFDELPTFDSGEGLVWAAFEEGDPRVYEDVSRVAERYNTDTPVRAEIIAPLGEHGVLITGSTETHAFDETEVAMFRSLAAAVEAALTRADREQQLTRQNERLEEFSRVVAHDLRNPITVADGFLDLVRETGDPDDFDRVERALDRMSRLVDDLLALARRGETDREEGPVDLAATAREAWGNVETGAATLDADGLPAVTGDEGRLAQLFENCFRNAVEHGGEAVTVRSGALDGGGFYVEDDGGGVPADERDRVFEQGYTTRREGTGFGLAIVETVAAAHGLSVEVVEGADGGARFEFRPA